MSAAARFLACLMMVFCGLRAVAAEPVASQAWIRVLPGDLPMAGYFVLANPGEQSLMLTGAHSAAFRQIEIHRSMDESGVARMMKVERAPLPAHARLVFEPGGYHLMLFGRTRTLQPGADVPITLEFADGSRLAVPFVLREATAR